jgi:ubiquitin-protein ligase
MSEDMLRWKGTIKGPKETPCDGCTFAIDIDIELTNYPYEPPKMKFDTTVQALLAERTYSCSRKLKFVFTHSVSSLARSNVSFVLTLVYSRDADP